MWTVFMDGRTKPTSTKLRPSILSINPSTNWRDFMDGMDGRITFGFRPSIHPSIRPFRPSHSGKDGRKTSVFCRRKDGRKYQTFLIFPSIHFSIRKWNFPSICDGRNGRIDGRIDGRKRNLICLSIPSINPSSLWTDLWTE